MPPSYDKFQYIRSYYGVPAYKGMRVKVKTQHGEKEGVITDADGAYVRIRLDGSKISLPYHPTDGITYLPEGAPAA